MQVEIVSLVDLDYICPSCTLIHMTEDEDGFFCEYCGYERGFHLDPPTQDWR